ncbi:ribosomal protection-like ABC-F family protein [Lentilactobacillus sp. SPB1-3]|uniref:Ribosomal protection-like ABC-F family protein n=1 Tax=Lentilactobacillus terminaliae TaxID=3003483 RepID=A0ACD5DGD6_9LACO|nr:ATP-binding cassette domain-containing protein [Lentilactobacillus sp. SPB1-3]MCZ0976927.1 ATP-binding cassette domain-containing protein [Lentilactobacillus sp. SPB1-3]
MIILQVQDIAKRFNGENIFSGVNLNIQEKSRIALVGQNGAGKSTLVKIIMGEMAADEGQISEKKNLTIGYLAQDTGLDSNKTIYDEMESVFDSLKETESKIHKLEVQISQDNSTMSEEEFAEISKTYDNLRADFESNGGYVYEAEIRGVLHGFGFGEADYDHPINELSGGQKTQLALAKLLLEKPDLLILDEPTNHLDVETITWLEGYIKNYAGSLLIISHDRYFLDQIVNEVYEMAHKTLTHYQGNYTDFINQKELRNTTRMREYEKQQAKIAKLQEFVDKNIVRASTTKQAQARRKQLEKMDVIEKPVDYTKVARFLFTTNKKSGENVLKVSDAAIGYDHILSEPVNLEVKRHQAIAIVGPNGVGKSTLLKSILGKIPLIKGTISFGTGVDTGYYDQEQQSLHKNKKVLNELWDDHPTVNESDIRGILGSFLFSGDDVDKLVADLSGGEKARLLLTKLAMQHNNFLILDEPTNHLDIDSREVLERALRDFEGTILFVSHDRYFINQLATATVEISATGSNAYLGNYDYYVDKKAEQLAYKEREESQNAPTQSAPQAVSSDKQYYQNNKEAQKQVRKLTREVAALEEQLDTLTIQKDDVESQMTLPENFNDVQKSADLQNQLNNINEQIENTEELWESKSMELEDL